MYSGISIKRLNIESISQNKVQWATGIALLIHSVGIMGIIWVDKYWFASMTPLNLLLMFLLIVWSQPTRKFSFYLFIMIAFLGGMISEIIGVQTGFLFGDYTYGSIMGFQVAGVPLIIGLNWFVVLYGAIATVHYFIGHFTKDIHLSEKKSACSPITQKLIIGGALMAVFFDWVMEPVAVDLGFWTWAGEGHIPTLNYLSWFLICSILLSIFRICKIRPDNLFAVHLFLIQLMFFILLRVFL
jgi:bisanhydrobacterioruberin hydratase